MVLLRAISVQVFFYFSLHVTVVSGDLFTLASFVYEKLFCSNFECCTDRLISNDYEGLLFRYTYCKFSINLDN